MKICYIGNAQSVHVQRWAEYFVKEGNEIHLITDKWAQINGVQLHLVKSKIKMRHLFLLLKLPTVRKLVKKIDPDVLHSHYVTSYGLWGALSNFHPLVLTAWGSDILVDPEKYFGVPQLPIRYVLGKADLVHSVAHHLTRECVELGANPGKIVTFPLTPILNKFNPNVRPVLEGENIVVSTRALEYIYDIKTLIKAVSYVVEKVPNVQFVVAGDGSQKNSLERLAKSQGIDSRVKFAGHVPHDDIPRLLTSADVYVSTSLSDGTSVSLLEAMACGVFPVVTDIEANRSWIQEGLNGFLFPIKDPRILAQKIVEALGSKKLRDGAGNRNWRMIGDHLWEKNMKMFERKMLELKESKK